MFTEDVHLLQKQVSSECAIGEFVRTVFIGKNAIVLKMAVMEERI